MPTNQQRREAAKRKLERQLERRAQKARRRKQLTIAGSVIGVIVVVAGGVGLYFLTKGDDKSESTASDVACTYTQSPQPAVREVTPPAADGADSLGDTVSATIQTNLGPIGLTLDKTKSPCTVNNFVSLAGQKFFDNTKCHRLTTNESLKVLQCGDPSETGAGGPGYSFADEYPVPKKADDPYVPENIYTRGTLAMANSGPDTNGSQFFLVYGDSKLTPDYTIFGTIDEAGLTLLDQVAAAGVAPAATQPADAQPAEPAPQDGKPNQSVELLSVTTSS